MRIITLLIFFLFATVAICQTTDNKGRKQGYWKKKDANDKLVYEGMFKDDLPIGKFKYYYPNDSVRAIMTFVKDGKVAYANLFHPSGKRMAQGKYVNKEVKDSIWTYYDEAGVLISKESYKNGKKDGAFYVYLPDGIISEAKNYKNDVQQGEAKEFFNDGSTKSKLNYVDGKIEGRASYFYPNGTEVAAGYYKNGLKNGPWIYKTESGKVREKELYKNGSLASEKETAEFFAKNKEQNSESNASKNNKPKNKK